MSEVLSTLLWLIANLAAACAVVVMAAMFLLLLKNLYDKLSE